MFCRKCHYTSFDHLPTCPKCAYDWSQQKKTFNVEWMVPTAAEGMSIFTPASPTGQAESLSGPAARESGREAAAGEEQEIDLDVAELEVEPEGPSSISQTDEESEDSLVQEVDDEITFEGLQDFSTDLNEETEASSSHASEESPQEYSGQAADEQEPELEIEIEDQGSFEGGEEKAEQEDEPLSVDQDELDLDISSILDEIDSDSRDRDSENK